MPLGKRVQALPGNEFLRDLPLELNAVGTLSGHGFHPLKAQLTKLSGARGALQWWVKFGRRLTACSPRNELSFEVHRDSFTHWNRANGNSASVM